MISGPMPSPASTAIFHVHFSLGIGLINCFSEPGFLIQALLLESLDFIGVLKRDTDIVKPFSRQ